MNFLNPDVKDFKQRLPACALHDKMARSRSILEKMGNAVIADQESG